MSNCASKFGVLNIVCSNKYLKLIRLTDLFTKADYDPVKVIPKDLTF